MRPINNLNKLESVLEPLHGKFCSKEMTTPRDVHLPFQSLQYIYSVLKKTGH